MVPSGRWKPRRGSSSSTTSADAPSACVRTGSSLAARTAPASKSRDPRVHVTCAGWVLGAQAEIVEDRAAKRALVSAHPFFPPAPFAIFNLLHRTLLRP